MSADASYSVVRERLLQGLVYCTNPGYAQLGFPTSEEGGFFERPSKCPPLCDDTLVLVTRSCACVGGAALYQWWSANFSCTLEIRIERWHRPKKAE